MQNEEVCGLSLKKLIEVVHLPLPIFCTQFFYLVLNMIWLYVRVCLMSHCHLHTKIFQDYLEVLIFNVRKNMSPCWGQELSCKPITHDLEGRPMRLKYICNSPTFLVKHKFPTDDRDSPVVISTYCILVTVSVSFTSNIPCGQQLAMCCG